MTGASRGAGRGIAVELGEAGATVYVTGRSTRAQPATTYGRIMELSKLSELPGNIDDTPMRSRQRAAKASPCVVTTAALASWQRCSNASSASRDDSISW